MTTHRLCLAVALIVALLCVRGVHAQAPTTTIDSEENLRLAKEHYRRGTNAYRAGDLTEAVNELRAAVKRNPTANAVFALGQALREKGDLAAAAHQYRQYLVLAPTGPFFVQSRQFLASIEEAQKKERSIGAQPPTGIPVESGETKPVTVLPVSVPPSSPPAALVEQPTPPPPAAKKSRPRWVWGVVGGSVAVVLVGVGLGLGVALAPPKNATVESSLGTIHPF